MNPIAPGTDIDAHAAGVGVPTGGSLRERKKAQTRQAIIAAAWVLFQQNGVSGTSIRDIAELADVSDTTVINYFVTKDDLVAAAVDVHRSIDELVHIVSDRPEDEAPATAVRRAFSTLGHSMGDADVRRQLRVWTAIDRDADLHAASLRLQVRTAAALAHGLTARARRHGQDALSVLTYCRAATAALDAIAGCQPPRVTARQWFAHTDSALSRLEKGWTQ